MNEMINRISNSTFSMSFRSRVAANRNLWGEHKFNSRRCRRSLRQRAFLRGISGISKNRCLRFPPVSTATVPASVAPFYHVPAASVSDGFGIISSRLKINSNRTTANFFASCNRKTNLISCRFFNTAAATAPAVRNDNQYGMYPEKTGEDRDDDNMAAADDGIAKWSNSLHIEEESVNNDFFLKEKIINADIYNEFLKSKFYNNDSVILPDGLCKEDFYSFQYLLFLVDPFIFNRVRMK